jgi:hypothetical protein
MRLQLEIGPFSGQENPTRAAKDNSEPLRKKIPRRPHE